MYVDGGSSAVCSTAAGHPAFHPRSVRAIVVAEDSHEPRFVAQHSAMEPDDVIREQRSADPRAEKDREPAHEDQVAKIHRIAHVTVRALGDETLRRHLEPGAASAFAQPVAAGELVLQVAPCE